MNREKKETTSKEVDNVEVPMDETKMLPKCHYEKYIEYDFDHLLYILFIYANGVFFLPNPTNVHQQIPLDICEDIDIKFNHLHDILHGETRLVVRDLQKLIQMVIATVFLMQLNNNEITAATVYCLDGLKFYTDCVNNLYTNCYHLLLRGFRCCKKYYPIDGGSGVILKAGLMKCIESTG